MKSQFLLILCLMPFVSCTTLDKDIGKDDNESRVYEIHMQMTRDFHRCIFIVDGVAVGESLSAVQDYLSNQKECTIIFWAGYKLASPERQEILDFFSGQNFHLKQFWVPTSSFFPPSPYPGYVDLLAPYDEEKWKQEDKK